ncbi:CatB-related O-acetyltransferase [Clostridium sp.]|uniref:CatB-related O-acetyltransferase n=1 Tax=Clostridium sp. TaxID=1506 RepID=UPI00290CDD78|nr:CatB-related O-acetyltransferase [Clostridium sp.]MDU4738665.1 CatB-related O-acetyltransferase [Clostridium sp.]
MFKKSILSIVRNSSINRNARVLSFTKVYDSSIGSYTYIGRNSLIIKAKIGKYCSIAEGVKIGIAKHPTNYVSTSPVFYNKRNVLGKSFSVNKFEEYSQSVIGNDVWIGMNSIIMPGIIIGDGAIIGTNSVVTKNVEPYSIVGGVPARVIRRRFNEETINNLLEICWWDFNDVEIKENAYLFNDINKFLEEITVGDRERL